MKYKIKLKRYALIKVDMGPKGQVPLQIGEVEDYIEENGEVTICIRFDSKVTKIMKEEIIKHPERITIISQLEEPHDIWDLPSIEL